jgi:alpha-galactosidase
VWTGQPSVIYGNVRNNGLITSLPEGCAVEVPCLVDRNGIQPTHIGELPVQLTALIRTNINVQELTVKALLTENREHIYHAAMMDPHTGAELDLDQIWALTSELLAAHGEWLPAFARVETRKAG